MSTTTLTTNGSNTAVTLNNTLLSTVNCVQNWKYTYAISYSAPKNILEIGSGQSTLIALEAIKKNKNIILKKKDVIEWILLNSKRN